MGATFYVESLPLDTDSASESLRRLVWIFSFSLNEGSSDFDLPERLRYFGQNLVWDLQKRGFLYRDEATRLLDLWGGAKIF
ncbi:MAG: hypothetical protein FWG81_09630 [Betaproteobacteria bacterium]|nr:hypothetical protein [Betaproteobacteria bacterium]